MSLTFRPWCEFARVLGWTPGRCIWESFIGAWICYSLYSGFWYFHFQGVLEESICIDLRDKLPKLSSCQSTNLWSEAGRGSLQNGRNAICLPRLSCIACTATGNHSSRPLLHFQVNLSSSWASSSLKSEYHRLIEENSRFPPDKPARTSDSK